MASQRSRTTRLTLSHNVHEVTRPTSPRTPPRPKPPANTGVANSVHASPASRARSVSGSARPRARSAFNPSSATTFASPPLSKKKSAHSSPRLHLAWAGADCADVGEGTDELDLLADALWPRLEARLCATFTRLLNSEPAAASADVDDLKEGEPGDGVPTIDGLLRSLVTKFVNDSTPLVVQRLEREGWLKPPPVTVTSADSESMKRMVPQMKFVNDVNLQPGTVVAPATQLLKIWRVRNIGDVQWPEQLKIVKYHNDNASTSTSTSSSSHISGCGNGGGGGGGGEVQLETDLVMFTNIAPSEEFNVSVLFNTPKQSLTGHYRQFYQLAFSFYDHWIPFGDALTLDIVIKSEKEKASRTSLTASPASGDSNGAVVHSASTPASPAQSSATRLAAAPIITRARSKSEQPEEKSSHHDTSKATTTTSGSGNLLNVGHASIPPVHPTQPSKPAKKRSTTGNTGDAAEELWSLIPASAQSQPQSRSSLAVTPSPPANVNHLHSDTPSVSSHSKDAELDWLNHARTNTRPTLQTTQPHSIAIANNRAQSPRPGAGTSGSGPPTFARSISSSLSMNPLTNTSDLLSPSSGLSVSSPPTASDDLMSRAMAMMGNRTTTNRLTGEKVSHPAPPTPTLTAQPAQPQSQPVSQRHSLPSSLSLNTLPSTRDSAQFSTNSNSSIPDLVTQDWLKPS